MAIVSIRVGHFKADSLEVKLYCRQVFGKVRMLLLDETLRDSLEEQEQRRVLFFSRDLSAIEDEFEPVEEVTASQLQQMLDQVRAHPKTHFIEHSFDGIKLC